jgi:hypothetical protein
LHCQAQLLDAVGADTVEKLAKCSIQQLDLPVRSGGVSSGQNDIAVEVKEKDAPVTQTPNATVPAPVLHVEPAPKAWARNRCLRFSNRPM